MAEPVSVTYIGPRPDPAASPGGTVCHVLEAVRDRCRLRVRATAGGDGVNGLAMFRLARTALASVGLLLRPRGNLPRLYLTIDTSLDLDCATMLATAARLRGYQVFVHHVRGHWLDQAESRLGLLDRLAGDAVVHVLPSEELVSRLRWVYRTQKQAVAAPRPVDLLQWSDAPRPTLAGRAPVLGVILDVGPDPAVTDAMNTFVYVAERAGGCRLVTVGEPVRRTHRAHLDDAAARFGDAVEDRGAVDAAGFAAFCRDIDVLLLPARQTHDAWPPQVVQAMAMGAPVIARASGCVRSLIGDHGGAVIDAGADFPRKVLRLIQSWQHDPAKFDESRRHAAERGRHIAELSRTQFAAFLELIAPLN